MNVIFAGRHILKTTFQEKYIKKILSQDISSLKLINKKNHKGKIDTIIFAITSANQKNTRYNPISFEYRLLGFDRFCENIKKKVSFNSHILGIPRYKDNENFIKTIPLTQNMSKTAKKMTCDYLELDGCKNCF